MTAIDAAFAFLGHWGLLVGFLGFAALFVARLHWLNAQLSLYTLNASYYCLKTQQSKQTMDEMATLWPADWIAFELWRWDWRRYIVHQDHFDEMVAFIVRELERPNLSITEMEREMTDPTTTTATTTATTTTTEATSVGPSEEKP